MNRKSRTKKVPDPMIRYLTILTALVIILLSVHNYLSPSAMINNHLNAGLSDWGDDSGEDFNYQFTIKDLQGTRIPFDQFKGKVVFLNLWATWCGPCRDEMKLIHSMFESAGSDRVEFVMLSIDRDTDKDRIVQYIQKQGFKFPVYQPSGRLPKQLQVQYIPTTWVISPEGKVIRNITGALDLNKKKTQEFVDFLKDLGKQVK